jgi:hypothetical protein
LAEQEVECLSWKQEAEETEEAFQLRLKQFKQNISVEQARLRAVIRSSIGEQLTIWIWYIGYHQAGDNFLELAAIAHESRKGVLQYEDFLEVPKVLHYAKQIANYVLMLDDDDHDN